MLVWHPRLLGFFPHIIILLSCYSRSLYYLHSQQSDEGKKPRNSSVYSIKWSMCNLLEVLSSVCLGVEGGVSSRPVEGWIQLDKCMHSLIGLTRRTKTIRRCLSICQISSAEPEEHTLLLKCMTFIGSMAHCDMPHRINRLKADRRKCCMFVWKKSWSNI